MEMDSVAIQNVVETLIDYRGKTPVKSSEGIRLITAKVIKKGRILEEPKEYLSEETYDTWMTRGFPQQWDVLITTEAPLGEVGILRTPERVALAQRVILLRAAPNVADQRFLFYALQGHYVQDQLAARASGTTVLGIKQSELRQVEVGLPPLPTQRRIASILSAYDDLIENNTRRIAILEEMARRLYEEWFVKFRFPGHEEVIFKESALGLIPEVWEAVRLDQVVDINPRTKVPKKGEKLFVPMSALSENSMAVGELQLKAGNSGAKFQNNDTLLARITPCLENGKTGFVDFLPPEQPTACGSTEFIILRSRSLCPEMVYLLARSSSFRDVAIKSMSGATGRQRVRVESLQEVMVPQPDEDTLRRFSNIVSSMFRQVKALKRKNTNLRTQRDLLLPKLVSGQIDVSEIELADTEEQAA